jgi:hypothetical protein
MGARSSKNTTQNNRSDGHLLEYFRNTFVRGGGGTNFPPPPSGLTATGGVISDYTDGPAVYRAHVFTSTGTFSVTAPGTFGDTVEYLVVAGGGGGGIVFLVQWFRWFRHRSRPLSNRIPHSNRKGNWWFD